MQDREPEAATRRTRAHASGQPKRAVQRLREAGLPLQRRKEAAKARTLLPAQFHLARQGPNSFRAAERLAEMRQKIANYKRFRELTDEWVDLVVELEQQEREQNR